MPSSGCQTCRSEEHTSELQSHSHLVCRLLLEKKKTKTVPSGCARNGRNNQEYRIITRKRVMCRLGPLLADDARVRMYFEAPPGERSFRGEVRVHVPGVDPAHGVVVRVVA